MSVAPISEAMLVVRCAIGGKSGGASTVTRTYDAAHPSEMPIADRLERTYAPYRQIHMYSALVAFGGPPVAQIAVAVSAVAHEEEDRHAGEADAPPADDEAGRRRSTARRRRCPGPPGHGSRDRAAGRRTARRGPLP